jgi:hypothetical protein
MRFLKNTEAFAAMQYFLDQYYWKTMADDIGGMSGCLMLMDDDSPVDQAFAEDWIDSVKVVLPNYYEKMLFTPEQAYAIVKEFLELYCRIGFSEEVQQLINRMALDQDGNIEEEINDIWHKALNLAFTNGPMYFQLKRLICFVTGDAFGV